MILFYSKEAKMCIKKCDKNIFRVVKEKPYCVNCYFDLSFQDIKENKDDFLDFISDVDFGDLKEKIENKVCNKDVELYSFLEFNILKIFFYKLGEDEFINLIDKITSFEFKIEKNIKFIVKNKKIDNFEENKDILKIFENIKDNCETIYSLLKNNMEVNKILYLGE